MKIPFVDLRIQSKRAKADIWGRFNRLIDESAFILGKEVEEFEHAFARYNNVSFSVGVGSGFDAIYLALKALDIGEGDEVIIPAHTFVATAMGVSQAGARPVLVDVEEETYCLNPKRVEGALSTHTKAIIPVHLYGLMMDMLPLMDIARRNDLAVIEDAAQAHGAMRGGHKAGSVGHIGCFSFYPSKNLGCYGDGGAIITNDLKARNRVNTLRNYGSRQKNRHVLKGVNSRLDAIQAAVLNENLCYLDSYNKARLEAARYYSQSLERIGDLVLPTFSGDQSHVFHLYVVRTPFRDPLSRYLTEKGVGVGIHYPTPIHLHDAYVCLGYEKGSFPIAEKICAEVLSLPIFPGIRREQLDYVIRHIQDFFSTRKNV